MSDLAEEFGIDIDDLHPAIKTDLDWMRQHATNEWNRERRYEEFSDVIRTLNISVTHTVTADHIARVAAQSSSPITMETFEDFLVEALDTLPANATFRKVQAFHRRHVNLQDYYQKAA